MRTIMIGIRNPKKDGEEANPWTADDAQSKCVEVWVNELRLTDFDQRGGWAALARLNTHARRPGHPERGGQLQHARAGAASRAR